MSKEIKLQHKTRRLAYSIRFVPELRMSGVWLEKNGFKAGQKVSVTIRNRK